MIRLINSVNDAKMFETHLVSYVSKFACVDGIIGLTLQDAFKIFVEERNSKRTFYAYFDLRINFALLMCDFFSENGWWHNMVKANRYLKENPLSSETKFYDRMLMHQNQMNMTIW